MMSTSTLEHTGSDSRYPMLRLRGLCKSYGAQPVLRNIDLDVKRGTTLAIIGPSGSGKSTLLRCINHLEAPTAGTVEIDGMPTMSHATASGRER